MLSTVGLVKLERAAIIKSFAQLASIDHLDQIIEFILDKESGINERTDVANSVIKWNSRFIDALVAVIHNPYEQSILRANFLIILSRIDRGPAYDAATWVLSRPEDSRIHWQAVSALGRVGDPRAIPIIERMLPNGNDTFKRVADRVLKKLKGGS